MIAALSLPPHNRGSLAGARAPPPLLRRVRRREWFSCCSWFLLSASRCGRNCRGSRAARLAALFVCVSCSRCLGFLAALGCPPVSWFVSVWFARIAPSLASSFVGSARVVRPCGASVARSLPRCRSLGRSGGLPSLWSAPSSRPLALLRRHSGLPLRGCFCPAVAGLVSFSPFRPPSRVLASLRLRPSVRAGNPRSLAPLLVCVPSTPI